MPYILFNSWACWYLLLFLDLHYWYTRTSTVTISILGTAFVAIRFALGTVIYIAFSGGSQFSIILMLMLFLRAPSMMIRAIVMIMTITRVNFEWKGATRIPFVRRVATHKERASMRLDSQTSWRAKIGVYCHFQSTLRPIHLFHHHSSFFPLLGSTTS